MNWLDKAAGFLFGGSSKSPVETVAGAIDPYVYTEQEKAADAGKDAESARAYNPPAMTPITPIQQTGLIFFSMEWLLRLMNLLVDAVIHLIRPWITIVLFGGVFGYWPLPDPSLLHPVYVQLLNAVVIFWFGARIVTKDLPALIEGYIKARTLLKK